MSDLISRQAAIDAVKFGITYAKVFNKSTGEAKELFKEGNKALNEAAERLKELPSIQPERKRGYVTYSRYCEELWGKSSICSLCGASWQIADEGDDNFCPNCGAELGSDTE